MSDKKRTAVSLLTTFSRTHFRRQVQSRSPAGGIKKCHAFTGGSKKKRQAVHGSEDGNIGKKGAKRDVLRRTPSFCGRHARKNVFCKAFCLRTKERNAKERPFGTGTARRRRRCVGSAARHPEKHRESPRPPREKAARLKTFSPAAPTPRPAHGKGTGGRRASGGMRPKPPRRAS